MSKSIPIIADKKPIKVDLESGEKLFLVPLWKITKATIL